jgi:hypothetical protein
MIIENNIFDNVASTFDDLGEGGGITVSGGGASLDHNLIHHNTANGLPTTGYLGLGGGLYLEQSDSILSRNIIYNNTASLAASGSGGGICFAPADMSRMYNNVVMHNTSGTGAGSMGAGIYSEDTSIWMSHTTLHSNTGADGTGVYFDFYGNATMTNTIIVSQSTGVYAGFSSFITLNGVLWFNNGLDYSGSGVSVSDAVIGNPRFGDDGFHITWPSAARNAGIDSGVLNDVDGQQRPYGLGYDLGADEIIAAWAELDPFEGGTMIYADQPGMTVTVQVPSGAVSETVTLTCEPIDRPAPVPPPSGESFAGRSFTLEMFLGPKHLEGYTFLQPAEVTVYYRDTDIAGLDESRLQLYYWSGSNWINAADTCSPRSVYVRDMGHNALSVPICHLSRWDMFGPAPGDGFLLFLPISVR